MNKFWELELLGVCKSCKLAGHWIAFFPYHRSPFQEPALRIFLSWSLDGIVLKWTGNYVLTDVMSLVTQYLSLAPNLTAVPSLWRHYLQRLDNSDNLFCAAEASTPSSVSSFFLLSLGLPNCCYAVCWWGGHGPFLRPLYKWLDIISCSPRLSYYKNTLNNNNNDTAILAVQIGLGLSIVYEMATITMMMMMIIIVILFI